jgi:predicted lactoylglutathione lyase
MMRKLFVNVPVKDLQKSVEFFTQLGFTFNPQFTDNNGTCMIIGEDAYVMLLTEDFFKRFTKKELVDAKTNTEVIIAISANSKDEVDQIVHAALAHGGKTSNDATDQEFMYTWSFQDIDDHLWEVIYMNPDALSQ